MAGKRLPTAGGAPRLFCFYGNSFSLMIGFFIGHPSDPSGFVGNIFYSLFPGLWEDGPRPSLENPLLQERVWSTRIFVSVLSW